VTYYTDVFRNIIRLENSEYFKFVYYQCYIFPIAEYSWLAEFDFVMCKKWNNI